MSNKPKLEHAEQNAIIKTNSKVVDASTLDKESLDKLIQDKNNGESIVLMGNSKDLPPVSAENNIKDVIGKFREPSVGAIIVENGEVKLVTPKRK